MNRKTILSIIIFSFFVILPSYSESDKHVFGGALSVSTNGVGGNLYWNPTSRWSVQAGYEQMRLRRRFDFEENDLKMDARLSYKTGGLSFTAGFQCLKWLYFKSGIALLFFNPALKAIPCDEFKFGDIYIKPDAVGSLRV